MIELAAFSKVAAAPQDEVPGSARPCPRTKKCTALTCSISNWPSVACGKKNIYAEAAMGCTGPVVKLAGSSLDKARAVLTASGYL